MKDKQLSKLYDLMKVITMSYKGEKEAIEDCLEIDRIIWELINERHTKEDLLWSNEKWKSYEGKYYDLFKYEREHEKVGHPIGYSYTNKDGKEICLATIGVFDNKEEKGMVRIRDFYDENGNEIRNDWWKNGALNHKSVGGWFKNGEQDGLWTDWFIDGQKECENNWKDGKKDGLEIRYFGGGSDPMFASIVGLIATLDYYEDGVKVKILNRDFDTKKQKYNWVEFENKIKVIVSDDGKSIKEIIKP